MPESSLRVLVRRHRLVSVPGTEHFDSFLQNLVAPCADTRHAGRASARACLVSAYQHAAWSQAECKGAAFPVGCRNPDSRHSITDLLSTQRESASHLSTIPKTGVSLCPEMPQSSLLILALSATNKAGGASNELAPAYALYHTALSLQSQRCRIALQIFRVFGSPCPLRLSRKLADQRSAVVLCPLPPFRPEKWRRPQEPKQACKGNSRRRADLHWQHAIS